MIGQTVQRLRRRLGLTQAELAKELGVKQQNIEQLENGKIQQPRYIKKLAEFFCVSISQLYSGEIDNESAVASRKQAHQMIDGLNEDQCKVVLKLIESVYPRNQ